jgi:hypothetical protein
MQRDPNAQVSPTSDLRLWSWRGTRTRNLLFTRQERIVHGVLARTVLAAHIRCAVQPVRSCPDEWRQVD